MIEASVKDFIRLCEGRQSLYNLLRHLILRRFPDARYLTYTEVRRVVSAVGGLPEAACTAWAEVGYLTTKMASEIEAWTMTQ